MKAANLRDRTSLDSFNWSFNSNIDRTLIFELLTCRFIERHEDVLILGNAGVGKSRIAQGIAIAAIHGGFPVLYREAHQLFEELVFAEVTEERSQLVATLAEIPLLIIDDLGMLQAASQRRRRPPRNRHAALRTRLNHYHIKPTLEDWPKMFGDTPAVTAFLDRLMHHGHFIQICGKSYRLHESSTRPESARQRLARSKLPRRNPSRSQPALQNGRF